MDLWKSWSEKSEEEAMAWIHQNNLENEVFMDGILRDKS